MVFFDAPIHFELAQRIDVPPGTVRSGIRRGLESLKGCLAG
ncbi:hypothetical protein [Croceicoccus pelagius]|nr:hypothetical protein [Croceicoccus pelagius]